MTYPFYPIMYTHTILHVVVLHVCCLLVFSSRFGWWNALPVSLATSSKVQKVTVAGWPVDLMNNYYSWRLTNDICCFRSIQLHGRCQKGAVVKMKKWQRSTLTRVTSPHWWQAFPPPTSRWDQVSVSVNLTPKTSSQRESSRENASHSGRTPSLKSIKASEV